MRLNGGPLSYESAYHPQPLSLEDEAALAFAGAGITGHALAELPYQTGNVPAAGGGNIMTHFSGRTVASDDAMHATVLFVINDEGTSMLKRPQDFPRAEIPTLIQMAREGRLIDLYQQSRVRIADRRAGDPARGALYADLQQVDERHRFQPAGIARFARSRGGHLYDDPKAGRVATVGVLETWVYEFAAIEQGAMLQNLALTTQALGLGGFPHFAAHPFIWFQAPGFRMEEPPFSRTIGAGPLMKGLLKRNTRTTLGCSQG